MPITGNTVGTLSTQVTKLLTAQVDTARNVANSLKDVILNGYGSNLDLNVNGLILGVKSGMVSCGGRIGYLTADTDQTLIPANNNVRVIAKVDLAEKSFNVYTK
jgi:hypothetical protein